MSYNILLHDFLFSQDIASAKSAAVRFGHLDLSWAHLINSIKGLEVSAAIR